jgi:hypothetical protein
MNAMTQKEQDLTVAAVVRAVGNITKMNKRAYNFLYLAQGFIAHYDQRGFMSHYEDNDLRKDIIDNAEANRWTNFRQGDRDYEYYKAKADVYQRVVNLIR